MKTEFHTNLQDKELKKLLAPPALLAAGESTLWRREESGMPRAGDGQASPLLKREYLDAICVKSVCYREFVM